MPEPRPLGDTSFRAIVWAILVAEPVNVLGGGLVESVVTRLTHRFFLRVVPISVTLEELNLTLVFLRGGACLERSKIPPPSGFRILLSRIQPIAA